MPRALLRMNTVPSNAAFCKQLILMEIPILFKCFSRLSLIVLRAPVTTGIIVALLFYSLSTSNLSSSLFFCLFVCFQSFLISLHWCYEPLSTLHQLFCNPFSLCQLSQCYAFYVLFQYLLVFCIFRFPALTLGDESITSLHILFQISCK